VPVGQHHVVRLLALQALAVAPQRGLAGIDFVRLPAPGADQARHQFAAGAVVVGHQQAQLAQRRLAPLVAWSAWISNGRLNQKVEPCPGRLLTAICPPISSIRRLVMASPGRCRRSAA
jgi:hypothetical protein